MTNRYVADYFVVLEEELKSEKQKLEVTLKEKESENPNINASSLNPLI